MRTRPRLHMTWLAICAAALGALAACGDGTQTNKAAAARRASPVRSC